MVRDIARTFFAYKENDLVWQIQENPEIGRFQIATFFTELQKLVEGTGVTFISAHENAKNFIANSPRLSKVVATESMGRLISSNHSRLAEQVLPKSNNFTRLSSKLMQSLPRLTRIALAALATFATGMALPTIWRMLPDDTRGQLESEITQMAASTKDALSKWQDTLATPHPTRTLVPTQSPNPTYTPTPTYTPSPTETPRPTSTPLPTETPQLDAVLNDAEFVSSKPSMYGIYHQIPTTQSLRLGDDVGFFPTQHIPLSGEVSRNPFGHIQNLPIDFDKYKQALIYTTKITSRQILPPSGYRIEALFMQQPYAEMLSINPVGTILIDSDKVPVPYGQDITVVAYPRSTVSEKRSTPYAYALDTQRQIELDTLNASLYQDSILQKIHASFVAELKSGPDRASQIAKSYTQLLQEYTYTYRYYSIDTSTNNNIKPSTSLVWLAQNPDAPYYCAIAADAAAQFFESAGFRVYIQIGHDTSIGLNKTLVTGILHANIILELPDGEVFTVDLTPIPASIVNSQTRQFPGSRFAGQTIKTTSSDTPSVNLKDILGSTRPRPTSSALRRSIVPKDPRVNLTNPD